MTKKLLFVIALILTLVCVFSSCDNTTPSGTPSETPSETPSHTHSYSEWTIVKNATCTSDGTQERTCACGAKETKNFTFFLEGSRNGPVAR